MRKILVLLLVLGLIFALAACSYANETPAPQEEESLSTQNEPQINEEPVTEEEPPSPPEEEITPVTEEPPQQENPSIDNGECDSEEYEPDDVVRCGLLLEYTLVIDWSVDIEALGLTIMRLEYGEGPGPFEEVTFMHMLDYDELRGSGDFEHTDTLMIRSSAHLRDFAVINMSNDATDDQIFFIPNQFFGVVENLLPGEAYIITSYVSVGTLPWSGITFLDDNGQRWYFAILQNQADEGDPYLLLPMAQRT